MDKVSQSIGIEGIRLIKVFNYLPYPFLISELRHGTQWNIFVNDKFREEIGFTCEDIPTIEDWFDKAYPEKEYRRSVIQQWSQREAYVQATNKDAVEMHSRIHTHRGDRWYEVKASVLGNIRFVAFVDIDQEIVKEEELLRLNQNKNTTLSILSHDLRSPLNNLHSVLQLAMHGDLTEAERNDLLGKLTDQVFNMLEFLDTTLQWTRINFNEITTERKEVDAMKIVQSLLQLYEKPTTEKNIKIHIDLGNYSTPMGDPEIISILVRNLLSNAIKYTSTGGTITIFDQERGGNVCFYDREHRETDQLGDYTTDSN